VCPERQSAQWLGWFHERYRVTRGGWLFGAALALLAAGAVAFSNNLLFLIVAAMLATLLVSGLVSRLGLAGLELELLLPEHIAARQRTPARLRLRNLKRLFPSFSIEVSGPAILDRPVYFPLLPGGAGREEAIYVEFPRRGRHGRNLFQFTTRFPFGLFEKSARVTIVRDTLVYPPLAVRPGFAEIAADLAGELELPVRGQGRDFYRVRPYQVPDSARHIDWRSTAHTGQMQVREYSADPRETAELYLDRRAGPHLAAWFEDAIECCASVAWDLAQRGIKVRLRSQGFTAAVPDDGDIYTILKFLALAQPLAPSDTPDNVSSFHLLLSASPRQFADDGVIVRRCFAPGAEL